MLNGAAMAAGVVCKALTLLTLEDAAAADTCCWIDANLEKAFILCQYERALAGREFLYKMKLIGGKNYGW